MDFFIRYGVLPVAGGLYIHSLRCVVCRWREYIRPLRCVAHPWAGGPIFVRNGAVSVASGPIFVSNCAWSVADGPIFVRYGALSAAGGPIFLQWVAACDQSRAAAMGKSIQVQGLRWRAIPMRSWVGIRLKVDP